MLMRKPDPMSTRRTCPLVGVLLGFCLAGFCGQNVWAITGAEVMERTQERFADYRTFAAEFEKQFHWGALDRNSSREGRLYLRRPSQFRLQMEDGSLVVADGEAIWSYSPRNQQVIVSPYEAELQTPWEVLVDYSARYSPVALEEVKLGRHDCYLLVLRPEVESTSVVQMKVWIDRKRWYLRRAEQYEPSGNITTYILSDVETNKKLKDSLFEFDAPAGVEIIDRRPRQPAAEDGGRP